MDSFDSLQSDSELIGCQQCCCRQKDAIIEELKNKYEAMKAQFDSALKSVDNMKEIKHQSEQMKYENKRLAGEKDELQHRLNLMIEQTRENESNLKKAKIASSEQRQFEVNAMNQRIKATEEKYTNEIKELYNDLQATKAELEQTKIQEKTIQGQLDRMFQNAERYFDSEISNIEELINLFKLPRSSKQVEIIRQNDNEREKALKKKYRSATKEIAATCDRLHKDLGAATRRAKDLEARLVAANDENAKIKAEYENSLMLAEDKHKHEMALLEKRLNALQSELEENRTNFSKTIEELQKVPTKVTIKEPEEIKVYKSDKPKSLPEDLEKIESLTLQNKNLNEAISKLKVKNAEISQKLEASEKDCLSISNSLTSGTSELNSIKKLYENAKKDIKSLQEQLIETNKAVDQREAKAAEDRKSVYKRKVQQANKETEAARKETADARAQQASLQSQIDDQKLALFDANESNEQLRHNLTQANEEIATLQQRIARLKQTSARSLDEVIPPGAWRFDGGDAELQSTISRIANNNSLQPASKLQNVLKAVSAYYQQEVDEREAALQEAYEENRGISNSISKFLVDVSICLQDEAFTIEEFFQNDAGTRFAQRLQSVKDEYDALKTEHEMLSAFVQTYKECFGSAPDMADHCVRLKQAIASRQKKLERRTEQVRGLTAAVKEMQTASENDRLDHEQERSQLEATIAQLSLNYQHANDELKKATAAISQLNGELSETRMDKEADERRMKQLMENEKAELLKARKEVEEKFSSELATMKSANDDLMSEIDSATARLSKARAALEEEKRQYGSLMDKLEKQKQQHADEVRKIEAQCAAEKGAIKQSYEEALAEIGRKCEAQCADISRLSEDLAAAGAKNESLQQSLMSASRQRKRSEKEIQALSEELERQKQLCAVQIRVATEDAEHRYGEKLAAAKARHEEEKRAMYAHVAGEFREFFDPSARIDNKSFKGVVEAARTELERLRSSDESVRRMINASEQQTTEDAIAQALLNF